jgi:hypothetical protein
MNKGKIKHTTATETVQECDLLVPAELNAAPKAPNVATRQLPASRDLAGQGNCVCSQNQCRLEVQSRAPLQRSLKTFPLPSHQATCITVAPASPSAGSTVVAVHAFALLDHDSSRSPITLCVPSTAVELYTNQMVAPMSKLSKLELRCPPPSMVAANPAPWPSPTAPTEACQNKGNQDDATWNQVKQGGAGPVPTSQVTQVAPHLVPVGELPTHHSPSARAETNRKRSGPDANGVSKRRMRDEHDKKRP